MIRNYFKVAWRNLWKNKLFSIINILGLGLAIPFALLSLMQFQSAFEYDNFHPDTQNLHRVITKVESEGGTVRKYASSPIAVSNILKKNYPFVENATHTTREGGWELTRGIHTIRINDLFVEPEFFEMFAFPLERGAIPQLPNTLAISRETATKFFGDEDPVGKTLSHPDYGEFIITGVLKPYKINTHFRSDVMVSMATYGKFNGAVSQNRLTGYSYVKLHKESTEKDLEAALNSITETLNKQNSEAKEDYVFQNQPFSKISPDFEGLENNPYVESLSNLSVNFIMALAIILLAGFNYTNLTLARSLNRAKEVGIRKASGATRHQLFTQFICEAMLVALLALAIGFFVLKLMEKYITVNWLVWQVDNNLLLWMVFLVFTILAGTVAGIIPARILSGFSPSKVLKGDINPASFGKIGFRKSLVVIQFVVTACFLFLIVSMYSQFHYQANDNENFNRKGIFNISVEGDFKLFKNDLAAHTNIERIGLTSAPFGGTSMNAAIRSTKLDENVPVSYYSVNREFIENMELEILAGDNLRESLKDTVSNSVIVNEVALFSLGIGSPEEAVGRTVYLNDDQQAVIQGVVKNFNYYLYQFPTRPLVLQYNPSLFNVLSIKTTGNTDAAGFRDQVEKIWKKYYPQSEISVSDYERNLNERYSQGEDMKFMWMICFTIFIIGIMGLLGIVTYTTEKRSKEIGIRKVMGASAWIITKELSLGFLKLLSLSAAICLPLGYVISYLFINNFVYNNGIPLGLMLQLFILIMIIALFTVGVQAAKAAMVNPVKTLRTE